MSDELILLLGQAIGLAIMLPIAVWFGLKIAKLIGGSGEK